MAEESSLITRYRTVVFIDFWNFERGIGHALKLPPGQHAPLDWAGFSSSLVAEVERALSDYRREVFCLHEGTRVYASAKGDFFTDKWFRNSIGLAPRHHLVLKGRDDVRAACLHCGVAGHKCTECGKVLKFEQEKGVDAALVTDLLWLAWQDLYDLAIVVSSDSDLIAGVERTQLSGRKVVNARFGREGEKMAQASWSAVSLDWIFEKGWHGPVWDVPGIQQTHALQQAGVHDPWGRLIRGENPLLLVREANGATVPSNVGKATEKSLRAIDAAARKAGYTDPD